MAPHQTRAPSQTRSLSLPSSGLRQVALFAVAYLLYGLARWVFEGDYDTAVANAHWIAGLEDSAGLGVERTVQVALDGSVWLWLLNHAYLAAQLVVVPGALIWLYRRSPRRYIRLRNTVLATWLLSVPVYALFPVAPPRLAELGFVDTITEQTGLGLDSRLTTALYNPLAAVPSLHAGFALAVGIAIGATAGHPLAKVLAALWPVLIGLAVVATGNHFLFDILAGFVATQVGFLAGVAVQRTSRRRTARPDIRGGPMATPAHAEVG